MRSSAIEKIGRIEKDAEFLKFLLPYKAGDHQTE